MSSMPPSPYQSQPSPRRVARIIQKRIQRGARQRFIRRITRWSRRSMMPQRVRATAIASPHTNGRKKAKTLTKRDAERTGIDCLRRKSSKVNHLERSTIFQAGAKHGHSSQLAQLVSNLVSISHSMRGRFSPLSNAGDHFLQNLISLSQWPATKAGTRSASGDITNVQGFSLNSDKTIVNTSAVSLAQLP